MFCNCISFWTLPAYSKSRSSHTFANIVFRNSSGFVGWHCQDTSADNIHSFVRSFDSSVRSFICLFRERERERERDRDRESGELMLTEV